jgi:hypothetical protein
MLRPILRLTVWALVLTSFAAARAQAAPFTAGNLVVVRVGTGGIVVPGDAAPVFLQEFTPTAINGLVQTFDVTAASGGTFTLSTNNISEGQLARSPGIGQFLTLAGYGTAPGTAAVSTSSSAAVPRVVTRVNQYGGITTSAQITNGYDGGPIHGAVTDSSATRYWTSGGAAGGTGGTRFVPLGSTGASTQINATATNAVNIYNTPAPNPQQQLYSSSSVAGNQGVNTVGTGLPTSGSAMTLLPNGAGGPAPGNFVFHPNGNTLYVADTRQNGVGIQKWTRNPTTGAWTNTVNFGNNFSLGATVGVNGLAVDFSGANPILYATTVEAGLNRIVSITDSADFQVFGTVATAQANTVFRGLTFTPVPEPGTLLLAGAVGAGFVAFRLRRRPAIA